MSILSVIVEGIIDIADYTIMHLPDRYFGIGHHGGRSSSSTQDEDDNDGSIGYSDNELSDPYQDNVDQNADDVYEDRFR